MRGGIGLGFLVLALWSSSAAAEESAPATGVAAARDAGPDGPVKVADGESRTALVGFQAPGHEARLETNMRPDGSSDEWHVVCVAPCTRRVPSDGTFRAAGSDFDASRPFRLPQDRERLVVTSQLGPKRHSRVVPILMTVLGWTSFGLVGPMLFVGGALQGNDAMALGGAALTLGGAVAGTAGIVLLVVSSHGKQSTVSIARGAAPSVELFRGIGLDARGLTF
jgi:hypothetical protein